MGLSLSSRKPKRRIVRVRDSRLIYFHFFFSFLFIFLFSDLGLRVSVMSHDT